MCGILSTASCQTPWLRRRSHKRIETIPLQSQAGLAKRDFGNGYVQLHLDGAGFTEGGSVRREAK